MDDLKKVSEFRFAYELSGDENFLINQKNPKIKNLIETKIASLKQIMDFFAKTINAVVDNHIPTGTIHAYAGEILKMDSIEGWLPCNGTQIPKKFYSKLYDVIGDMYKPDDLPAYNSDKFHLPNMKGMTIMGFCNFKKPYINESLKAIRQNIELAKTYGEFSHKLTEDEIPIHSHNPFNHVHKYFDFYRVFETQQSMGGDTDIKCDWVNNRDFPGVRDVVWRHLKDKKINDEFYSKTTEWGGNLGFIGNSLPHNNTQPSVVMNYIIKT
jgi:microcystin-dependent protein